MQAPQDSNMPKTAWIYPLVALVFYAVAAAAGFEQRIGSDFTGTVLAIALLPVLFGAVFAAVYHAEFIAHWSGEPYGTLVLTAAVTVIEVALITSVMLSDPDGSPTLARDTVFAVVMIVTTGMTGICIFLGGLRYREQNFRVSGASAYLSVLLVLATLTLLLPNYTPRSPDSEYSNAELAFVAIITLVLYGAFLYIQTVRHRDYFMTPTQEPTPHFNPSTGRLLTSAALLFLTLTAVVLLSKKFSIVVEAGREAAGAPPAVTGLIVALLILLPEGIAAVHAARKDALQKAINLSLGSALATIGMTFPAVAVVSLVLDTRLTLGLEPVDSVLLALTLLASTLTFSTGRTNMLHGIVHLVIFAIFLFLTFHR